jgi:ParB family chromosome partitioning protein
VYGIKNSFPVEGADYSGTPLPVHLPPPEISIYCSIFGCIWVWRPLLFELQYAKREGSLMSDGRVRARLGRGLSSLISISSDIAVDGPALEPESADTGAASTGPTEIPLEQIVPNPQQPRRTINPAAIAELAASLKSTGLVQPIVVRKSTNGYELIAGERRWRAAKQAGFAQIPAIVKEVDRFAQAQMALVENIQREDLNPIDRATAYRAIIEQLGLTQAELAQRLGEERSSIANHLRLLELSEPVRALVHAGTLSLGHAKLLAGVYDPVEQERLAKVTEVKGLSVRNLEQLIQRQAIEVPKTRNGPSTAYITDLEKSLTRQLGLRVQVKTAGKKGRGRLVIHYGSLDEFDRLMNALGVKAEA